MCPSIIKERDLLEAEADSLAVQEESSAQLLEDREQCCDTALLPVPEGGTVRERALAWLREIPGVVPYVRDDLRVDIPDSAIAGSGHFGKVFLDPDGSGKFYKSLHIGLFSDPDGEFSPPRYNQLEELLNYIQFRELAQSGVIPRLESVGVDDRNSLVLELQGLPNSFSLDGPILNEMTLTTRVGLYLKTAEKLLVLHDAGLLHNDVKGENIITDGKEVMLIDLGISRINGQGQAMGAFSIDLEERGTDSDVYVFASSIHLNNFLISYPQLAVDSGLAQLLDEVKESALESERSERPIKNMSTFVERLRLVHEYLLQAEPESESSLD